MYKATLKNYRQSPRKVRLVADSIKGKKVADAVTHLQFVTRRSSDPIRKLVESAIANAVNNHSVSADNLYVKSITVNEGPTLKRWMPRARGAAYTIRKRTSIVEVILDDKKGGKKVDSSEEKKVEKKEVKTTSKTKTASKTKKAGVKAKKVTKKEK